MGARSFGGDRAMSESISIALLVGMTVVVTAVVGVNVLVVGEDDGGVPQANFSYDHVEDSGLLLVTHERGDPMEAGRIEFERQSLDPDSVTWSELASRNRTEMVEPGDLVQLGAENAYGQRVTSSDTITIYYNESGKRTQLGQWDGG